MSKIVTIYSKVYLDSLLAAYLTMHSVGAELIAYNGEVTLEEAYDKALAQEPNTIYFISPTHRIDRNAFPKDTKIIEFVPSSLINDEFPAYEGTMEAKESLLKAVFLYFNRNAQLPELFGLIKRAVVAMNDLERPIASLPDDTVLTYLGLEVFTKLHPMEILQVIRGRIPVQMFKYVGNSVVYAILKNMDVRALSEKRVTIGDKNGCIFICKCSEFCQMPIARFIFKLTESDFIILVNPSPDKTEIAMFTTFKLDQKFISNFKNLQSVCYSPYALYASLKKANLYQFVKQNMLKKTNDKPKTSSKPSLSKNKDSKASNSEEKEA